MGFNYNWLTLHGTTIPIYYKPKDQNELIESFTKDLFQNLPDDDELESLENIHKTTTYADIYCRGLEILYQFKDSRHENEREWRLRHHYYTRHHHQDFDLQHRVENGLSRAYIGIPLHSTDPNLPTPIVQIVRGSKCIYSETEIPALLDKHGFKDSLSIIN